MAVSALSAAKTVCELRDWNVSNLELQKVLYIAHMFHLGRTGQPLVAEGFEAWDYGPVAPELYHHVKGFGSGPVRNVFHWIDGVPVDAPEYAVLNEVADAARKASASKLVAITHAKDGAWAAYYLPGFRGISIPDDSIAEEYNKRDRAVAGEAA